MKNTYLYRSICILIFLTNIVVSNSQVRNYSPQLFVGYNHSAIQDLNISPLIYRGDGKAKGANFEIDDNDKTIFNNLQYNHLTLKNTYENTISFMSLLLKSVSYYKKRNKKMILC